MLARWTSAMQGLNVCPPHGHGTPTAAPGTGDSSWVSQRLSLTVLSGPVWCPLDSMQTLSRAKQASPSWPGTFSLLFISLLREPMICGMKGAERPFILGSLIERKRQRERESWNGHCPALSPSCFLHGRGMHQELPGGMPKFLRWATCCWETALWSAGLALNVRDATAQGSLQVA